ncbi:hypothetical protein VMA_001273 [Vibrio mimicus VM223]|nr:hypothetical protein VMA_001273 [Vibrio mimicus VM223]
MPKGNLMLSDYANGIACQSSVIDSRRENISMCALITAC